MHLGSLYHDDVIDEAETRRGVPSVNARWSNIVAILSGDFLLAQASALAASLGADVAGLLADTIGELCRGQVLELQHLFDADPLRGGLPVGDRGQDRVALRDVLSHRRHGERRSTSPRSTRSRASATTSACASRSSTTCSTSRRATRRSASPRARTSLEGIYTLPVIYALAAGGELADLLGGPLDADRRDRARALASANGAVDAALAVAHDHATKAGEALAGADALDARVTGGLCRLVDSLVVREA